MAKKEKLKCVKNDTETSPPFENTLDAIHLLKQLNAYIDILEQHPSESETKRIQDELQNIEIMTVQHSENDLWITSPLILKKSTMKRPLTNRIAHLIQTKGEWKGKFIHQQTIEVESKAKLPLHIPVTEEAKIRIKNNEISPLLVAIAHMYNIIMDIMLKNIFTIGIFEKPNAIINMNKLKTWLTEKETETHVEWDMKYTLEVKNLYDILCQAVFLAPNETKKAVANGTL